MSYLSLESRTVAANQDLFTQINSAFGTVPNMFKAIGNSPAALESMWTSFQALGKGALSPKAGEQIAVLVADLNQCEYCLAAHTVLGQKAGATAEEMAQAQQGFSDNAATQAVLTLAKQLVTQHGQVSEQDIEAVRQQGFNDAQIAEILAHVALNIFTNYTNVAFAVPVDFPKVKLHRAA